MEVREYYTPDIEDLFAGYECESTTMTASWNPKDCNDTYNNDDIWECEPISAYRLCSILSYAQEDEHGIQPFIRTPYLNKSDIESLGWKYDNKEWFCHILKGNVEYRLHWTNGITITKHYQGHSTHTDFPSTYPCHHIIYEGNCKSINEFKKLMQWLQIPVKS